MKIGLCDSAAACEIFTFFLVIDFHFLDIMDACSFSLGIIVLFINNQARNLFHQTKSLSYACQRLLAKSVTKVDPSEVIFKVYCKIALFYPLKFTLEFNLCPV